MKYLCLALCATSAAGTVYFEEKFADKSWEKKWYGFSQAPIALCRQLRDPLVVRTHHEEA